MRNFIFRHGYQRLAGSLAQAITSSECVSELVFEQCEFHDQSSIAQLQSILQNKHNLTSLCLKRCDHFATFLGAIEKSKLERLEIHVTFSFDEALKQDLLRAVENNFSLRSVKGEISFERADLFGSAEDKQRLAFCANRNESLDQWVDNPEIVEEHKVWPEALSLAERAGPSALFRGLHSVLERDYVSLPSGRKRKRPQN